MKLAKYSRYFLAFEGHLSQTNLRLRFQTFTILFSILFLSIYLCESSQNLYVGGCTFFPLVLCTGIKWGVSPVAGVATGVKGVYCSWWIVVLNKPHEIFNFQFHMSDFVCRTEISTFKFDFENFLNPLWHDFLHCMQNLTPTFVIQIDT